MKFTVMTLFPDFIKQGLSTSILGKASEKGLLSVNVVDIRDYTLDKNRRVDDYTYGGGAGMLIQAQPVYDAFNAHCASTDGKKVRTVYVTPQGTPFSQSIAAELAAEEELVFLCGHYEGIDERVLDTIVTDRYSIGDYVLTGGELPALVMIDAISRLIPGVLGNGTSAEIESFYGDLLEYPQYTRPEVWNNISVPEVLLRGNPKSVEEWRKEKSEALTKKVRPDLYDKYSRRIRVLKELNKDKRNNIPVIEAIKRGMGEIINEHPLMVYNPSARGLYLYYSEGEKIFSFEDIRTLIPSSVNWIQVNSMECYDAFVASGDCEGGCICFNTVYTEKVHKKIKNKDIRPLDTSFIEIILENYHLGDEKYILDRLNRGLVFGLFIDNVLAGFIGEHNEGSIGMLYVFDKYRRQGIGSDLEGFMINRCLENGQTPFGQIIISNESSLLMQDKYGLYTGNRKIGWLDIIRK